MNAIILAGGNNSRMGQNKALLRLNGESLIVRIISRIREHFDKVIIVSDSLDSYADPVRNHVIPNSKTDISNGVYSVSNNGVYLEKDLVKGRGPLGGIYSGLKTSSSFYNFFFACDLPFINPELVELMKRESSGYALTIPRTREGYFHPLHAIYSKECLPPIEEQFKKNIFKVANFFSKVKVNYIEEEEIEKFNPYLSFYNINTREDYNKAKRLIGGLD